MRRSSDANNLAAMAPTVAPNLEGEERRIAGRQPCGRTVTGVQSDDPRAPWRQLKAREQRALVRAAKREKPITDTELAAAGCAWARSILGAPEARRSITVRDRLWLLFTLATEMLPGGTAAAVSPSIYGGDPDYDGLPAVRRAALAVERSCCDGE